VEPVVGAHAKASRELLTGQRERTKQITHDYEVAHLEFEESKKLLEEHIKVHGCLLGSASGK